MENNNFADREVEEKRRRERMQAEEFLGNGKRKAKIVFIRKEKFSMACVLSTVFGTIIGFSLGCIGGWILRYWVVSLEGVMGRL